MEILLIDDHHLFRDGLKSLLQQKEPSWVISMAGDAAEARVAVSKNSDLDLILLDYDLPDGNGLDLLSEIKEKTPITPIALLSAHEEPKLIKATLAAGASGFITKASTSDVMLSALQLIFNGGVYVPPAVLKTDAMDLIGETDAEIETEISETQQNNKSYHLTERQKEVLNSMVKGLANKEIARELDMSPSTVKAHIAAILRELEVNNRTQAVTKARENGLI